MKDYINQFYTEGFATTFYVKPLKFLKRKISNKNVLKVLSVLLKIIYTISMLLLAVFIFLDKYPL